MREALRGLFLDSIQPSWRNLERVLDAHGFDYLPHD
jgi:hypothetical protein